MTWKKKLYLAKYWDFELKSQKVTCKLCPRHCTLELGQDGFCRVRGNRGKKLYTLNFGCSINATVETIETEAIYHYSPGTKILSMGNIGCVMSCSFCQNWQTSQIKHLDNENVSFHTPEEVVEMALSNNINVISWTYNEPIVWHEFVVETSKLAKRHGIKTLYKSALYIEIEPLRELIEVIDIFSISLKSMSSDFYRKVTKGRLEPVLKAIKEIGKSNKHLEISQLVVTGLNDDGTDAKETASWIVNNLGNNIPLHFVGYHPAFRYTAPRTSLATLLESKRIALLEGIKYCYLGNVYNCKVSNTHCDYCGNMLVERFGSTVNVIGLNEYSCCKKCGEKSPIKEPFAGIIESEFMRLDEFNERQSYNVDWNSEIKSLHIVADEKYKTKLRVKVERIPSGKIEFLEMNKGLERILLSKKTDNESGLKVAFSSTNKMHLLPVLDRAHYPVIEKSKNKKELN